MPTQLGLPVTKPDGGPTEVAPDEGRGGGRCPSCGSTERYTNPDRCAPCARFRAKVRRRK